MKIIVACAVAALLTGCALPPPAGPGTAAIVRDAEDPGLARVLADYEAYLREIDPISAGMEGDKAAMSRLPDGSRAFEVAQEPALKAFADRLAAIARRNPAGYWAAGRLQLRRRAGTDGGRSCARDAHRNGG
jgi:hypothetical protein